MNNVSFLAVTTSVDGLRTLYGMMVYADPLSMQSLCSFFMLASDSMLHMNYVSSRITESESERTFFGGCF